MNWYFCKRSNKNAVAYCEMQGIHEIRRKGLIRTSKRVNGKIITTGICQGSAISAILANIYMLNFDELIHNEISKIGGLYRRYSDDMIVICPSDKKSDIIQLFEENIRNIELRLTHEVQYQMQGEKKT